MSATSITTEHHFSPNFAPWLKATLFQILRGYRTHAHLYAICVAVYVCSVIECLYLGLEVNYRFVPMISGFVLISLIGIVIGTLAFKFVQLVLSGHASQPGDVLRLLLLQNLLAPQRISNILHAVSVNSLFFIGLTAIKKAIPAVNPFAWDEALMQLDQVLHFGRLPHEWLIPSFGTAEYLFGLNLAYNFFWFLGVMACLFWYGFAARDSFVRQRYMLTYVSTMTLGTGILGSIFSSVGPCYYANIVQGANPYVGLTATLEAANQIYPLWALNTQQALWQSYVNGGGDIEGISAMPSMHVATAVLFLLMANTTQSKVFKYLTRAFAVVIFIGSFVLGWHYAVDGYVGLAVVLLCWWASGKYLRKRFPETSAA